MTDEVSLIIASKENQVAEKERPTVKRPPPPPPFPPLLRKDKIIMDDILKTHEIEIPTTCIEFLVNIHPKWYAFIYPPLFLPGDIIRFVNQGELVREVVVERVAPPGEFYEDEDFKGWTQVIFK